MSSSPFYLRGTGLATAADQLDRALNEIATSTGIKRLRAWALHELRIRHGETVVDVGSGNGSYTRRLASCAGPTGRTIGVELNDGLRRIAVQRANETGSKAEFTKGDALALPFRPASVDVVWCERVLQHLDEPDHAVKEISRVLSPGGRAVLIDTDWATLVISPGDPDTVTALARSAAKYMANPYSGRKLPGQLTRAGLEVVDMSSQATMRTHRDVRWDSLRKHAERAVELGLATTTEIDELINELVRATTEGTLHCSVTMFAAIARRP
ncbi:methyltransferase domain-containing protein [Streptomyces sp. NPDC098789]|uniref:methyltransferase domain-containing protein n=1 Tax=Streptomyces sp. NPDC098789 TaxID=3366098 RepID=UPI003805BA57